MIERPIMPTNKPDIPPENGKRPWIAPNGEVHGSGVGAGGGSPGEDFDPDPASGDGAADEDGPDDD